MEEFFDLDAWDADQGSKVGDKPDSNSPVENTSDSPLNGNSFNGNPSGMTVAGNSSHAHSFGPTVSGDGMFVSGLGSQSDVAIQPFLQPAENSPKSSSFYLSSQSVIPSSNPENPHSDLLRNFTTFHPAFGESLPFISRVSPSTFRGSDQNTTGCFVDCPSSESFCPEKAPSMALPSIPQIHQVLPISDRQGAQTPPSATPTHMEPPPGTSSQPPQRSQGSPLGAFHGVEFQTPSQGRMGPPRAPSPNVRRTRSRALGEHRHDGKHPSMQPTQSGSSYRPSAARSRDRRDHPHRSQSQTFTGSFASRAQSSKQGSRSSKKGSSVPSGDMSVIDNFGGTTSLSGSSLQRNEHVPQSTWVPVGVVTLDMDSRCNHCVLGALLLILLIMPPGVLEERWSHVLEKVNLREGNILEFWLGSVGQKGAYRRCCM
ncbi:hypothetical protein BCR39DRAFT_556816 [Naematelia encephala]|uniref:Uncharacterized protein n=1 Tax=Naematelia encephala TaxID=71784 RepID=A0A1Y2BIV6_9TREE|nr:hypothetical protein BCR39DRAFT_556816 [Naematelia encephala]